MTRVRLIDVLANTDRDLQGAASCSEGFNISSQPAGTYTVVIETAKAPLCTRWNKL